MDGISVGRNNQKYSSEFLTHIVRKLATTGSGN